MQSILSRRARQINTFDPVRRVHPLNQGCVAWWLALPHSQGGGTWYDLLGSYPASFVAMSNANNGWRSTTRPGGYGHVLFDGTAGYVQCRSSAILSGKPNWVIAAWVITTVASTSISRSIYCERGAAGNDILKMDSVTGGQNGFGITYRNDAGNIIQVFSADVINDGLWHRVVIVFTGTGFLLFRDGLANNSLAWSNSNTFTDAVQARIGTDAGDPSAFFQGSIDGVKLWTGNPLALASPAAFADLDYFQSRRGDPDTLNYL